MNTLDSAATQTAAPPPWLSPFDQRVDEPPAAWPWYLVSIAVIQIALIIILLLLIFMKSSAGAGAGQTADAGGQSGAGNSAGQAAESDDSASGGVSNESTAGGPAGGGEGDGASQGGGSSNGNGNATPGGIVEEEDERSGTAAEEIEAKLSITLSWNAIADLDLYVVCPSSETLCYSNTSSDDWGFFDSSGNPETSERKTETARWTTKVTKGSYKVRVKRDHTGVPGPVDFTVEWSQRGKREKHKTLIGRNEEIDITEILVR